MYRLSMTYSAYPDQPVFMPGEHPTKAHAHAAIPRLARKGNYKMKRLAGDFYLFTPPAGGGGFVGVTRVEG
jgi:hypothetical protein